jgi:hypothetical protein
MTLVDVLWDAHSNVLVVECCGARFTAPAWRSPVRCPQCGVVELWHGVEPKPTTGPWSLPVMKRHILATQGDV